MKRILPILIFLLLLTPASAAVYEFSAQCNTCYKDEEVCETVKTCDTCYKWVKKCDTCYKREYSCDEELKEWDSNNNNRIDDSEILAITTCYLNDECSGNFLLRAQNHYVNDLPICGYKDVPYDCRCRYVEEAYDCNCKENTVCKTKKVSYSCHCKPYTKITIDPVGRVEGESVTVSTKVYVKNPAGPAKEISIYVYDHREDRHIYRWSWRCSSTPCTVKKSFTLTGPRTYEVKFFVYGDDDSSVRYAHFKSVSIELVRADRRAPTTSAEVRCMQYFKDGCKAEIKAYASDDVEIKKGEVFLDGNYVGEMTLCTSKKCAFLAFERKLSYGMHELKIVAEDWKGKKTNDDHTLLIEPQDTENPKVTISPSSGTYQTTSTYSLSVTVSASDDVKVSKIELYLNGDLVETKECGKASCSFTTSLNLIGGQHTVKAVAIDWKGKKSSATATYTVKVSSSQASPGSSQSSSSQSGSGSSQSGSSQSGSSQSVSLSQYAISAPYKMITSEATPPAGGTCYRIGAMEWRCTKGGSYVGGSIVALKNAPSKSGKFYLGKSGSIRVYAYTKLVVMPHAEVSGSKVVVPIYAEMKQPSSKKISTSVSVEIFLTGAKVKSDSAKTTHYTKTFKVSAAPGDEIKATMKVGSNSLSFTYIVTVGKPFVPSGAPTITPIKLIDNTLGDKKVKAYWSKISLDGKKYTIYAVGKLKDVGVRDPDYGRFCVLSAGSALVLGDVKVDGKSPGKEVVEVGKDDKEFAYKIPGGTHTITKTIRYSGGNVVKTWYATVTVRESPKNFDISVEAPASVPLMMGAMPVYVKISPGSPAELSSFKWCTLSYDFKVKIDREYSVMDVDSCEFKKRFVVPIPASNKPFASGTLKVKVCDTKSGECKSKSLTVKRSERFLAGSRITLNAKIEKGYHPVKSAYLQLGSACLIGSLDGKLKSYGAGSGVATFTLDVPTSDTTYKLIAVDTAGNKDTLSITLLTDTGAFSRPINCNGEVIDPGTPQVKITYPMDGAVFANAGTISVKASAWISGGTGSITKVVFSAAGKTYTDSSEPYEASFYFGCGEYTITATAYSSTGKTATDTVKIKVCIVTTTATTTTTVTTTTPPPCQISVRITNAPTECITQMSCSVKPLTYTASATCGLSKVEIYVDGSRVSTKTLSGTSASGSFDVCAPVYAKPGSSFTVKVVAYDRNGNRAEDTRTFKVCPPPQDERITLYVTSSMTNMEYFVGKAPDGRILTFGYWSPANGAGVLYADPIYNADAENSYRTFGGKAIGEYVYPQGKFNDGTTRITATPYCYYSYTKQPGGSYEVRCS